MLNLRETVSSKFKFAQGPLLRKVRGLKQYQGYFLVMLGWGVIV